MPAQPSHFTHYRSAYAQYQYPPRPANDHFIHHRGRIISFSKERGYGFIKCRGKSVFFSGSELLNPQELYRLKDGSALTFELLPTPRGYKAIKVQLQEPEQEQELEQKTKPAAQKEDKEARYEIPQEVLSFNHDISSDYLIVEEAEGYLLSAEHRSFQQAHKQLCKKAGALGANALCGLFCSTKKATESNGRGGIHYYSRSVVTARPCLVARKTDQGGCSRAALPQDLTQKVESALIHQEQRREINYLLLFLELVAVILSGLYAWFWPVPGFSIPQSYETKPFWIPTALFLLCIIQFYLCALHASRARIVEGERQDLLYPFRRSGFRRDQGCRRPYYYRR
ncbi:MAG: cold shock domain-containing protein [Proteobacteria bacterium]|uniref:Cold shock domain-containing protein n=1 Tax=Candidatus Avisuccinivibrio stercorigallinarum TaxID=2840704 RepID=A0A9D9DA72_9GAMM|nr:cold shock domain-containing protein [Candidatus Avisuccinivibrio stercorigallinarum]